MSCLDMVGLTILGTDTEIGKSYVACSIIRRLVLDGKAVAGYKPVASGAISYESSDAYQLWEATGFRGSIREVNPQSFREPVAPPIAAEMEARSIDDALMLQGAVAWKNRCDVLIVEGAGGIMSPLSFQATNADLARSIGFPVVLVAINRLGVVNQVLSALMAAKQYELDVRCIVLNDGLEKAPDSSMVSNLRLLTEFMQRFRFQSQVVALSHGGQSFRPEIDWWKLASSE